MEPRNTPQKIFCLICSLGAPEVRLANQVTQASQLRQVRQAPQIRQAAEVS